MQGMLFRIVLSLLMAFMVGCASYQVKTTPRIAEADNSKDLLSEYVIGPRDIIQVFVWRNPDISVTIPVRPDGKISSPLVEDMVAVGKTPSQLARDIEKALTVFIKEPVVNIIVTDFAGRFSDQIRVVGQAASPRALPFRDQITLLDVIIEVGGLTEFAAGNNAKIVRRQGKSTREINVRLDDLISKGDVSTNIKMNPGDILVIPESSFLGSLAVPVF